MSTNPKISNEQSSKDLIPNLHWMYGIEEYLQHIRHPELNKFLDIKKALMYGNLYKVQKLVLEELHKGPNTLSKEFIRVLFSGITNYEFLTHRKVLNYISRCIDDEFIKRINKWSLDCEELANFNDNFSKGQIKSKIWLVEELKNVFPNKDLGTLAHYGGWYATVAHFLFENFTIDQYYNIELDPECVWIGDFFNYERNYKGICMDVNNIKYDKNSFKANDIEITPTVILNTSCEHMDNKWFDNLPKGTLVSLQTNDYFENPQHVNCCRNLQTVIEKYPMQDVYYNGELDTKEYTRFMLIGKK